MEKAGSYIESNLKAVKSWLVHNGIEIKGRIKIRGAWDTPTLRDKRALSGTELSFFFNVPPQTRCAGALVAQAGLRIETIGYYEGTDGLRIGDLPELELADDNERESKLLVRFVKVPTMIVVRPELSKAGHQCFTFLAEEGCRHIADYLIQGLKSGEKLTNGSALIPLSNSRPRKKNFVRNNLVGDLIRKRLRACGINARPYDLRSTSVDGVDVAYSGDAAYSPGVAELSKGADLLIHESTFLYPQHEEAVRSHHSTARDAARKASEAGVRHPVMSHISFE